MESYQKKEIFGRDKVEECLTKTHPNIKWDFIDNLEDKFDATDITITATKCGKSKTMVAEIKYRTDYEYGSFDDSILEKLKLDRIMAKFTNDDKTPLLYMMMWKCQTMEIYDLRKMKKMIDNGEIKMINKLMRKDNVRYEKVYKQVYLLPHQYASTVIQNNKVIK